MQTFVFRTRAATMISVLFLMLATTRSDAATFCVASATDLVAALADVSGIKTSNEIRIVSGVYDASGLDLVMDDAAYGDLKISGNWAPGCAGTPGFDARETIIGGGADENLTLVGERRLELQALTFSKFLSLNALRKGDLGGHAIRFDGVRLIGIGAIVVHSESAGPIDLRNLLVYDSGAANASCVLSVGQQVDDGFATTLLAQSTFAFNVGEAQVCLVGAEANKLAHNNIFDGLGQRSVHVSVHEATFRRNRIQTLSGIPPSADSAGNFNTAPGFVDAPNRDFRLAAGSPAINRGYMVLPDGQRAFDLHGKLRCDDVRPDLGAIATGTVLSDVFMVTNTDDSGFGSLRAAVDKANKNADASIIRFNLANGCVTSIKLANALPNITAPLWVDGYSQPLSLGNSSYSIFNAKLCVRIEPMPAGFSTVFRAQNFDAPLRIEGIAFGGFVGGNGATVMIHGAHESVLRGNQFGGTTEAGLLTPSDQDISVASGSRDVQIGGPQLQDRNLFTQANTDLNLSIASGVSGTQLLGNWFGLDSDGHSDLHSAISVLLEGTNTWVLDNRFAHTDVGIFFNSSAATQNRIQRNVFGLDGGGLSAPLSSAIAVQGGADNVVGAIGDQAIGGNFIAGSKNSAITIIQAGAQPFGFRVRGNRIFATQNGLDIDLANFGPTANDPGDGDAGPNRTMNHPLLSEVVADGVFNFATGNIDTAAGVVLIDFYASNHCGQSGRGDSALHLGTASTSDGGFAGQFNIAGDPYLSATATDAEGNTSEVSPCKRAPQTFSDGFD